LKVFLAQAQLLVVQLQAVEDFPVEEDFQEAVEE
jgi:hypothetical protein